MPREMVVLYTEERDGLVYQLVTYRVDPASFDGGAETIDLGVHVVVRKALESS